MLPQTLSDSHSPFLQSYTHFSNKHFYLNDSRTFTKCLRGEDLRLTPSQLKYGESSLFDDPSEIASLDSADFVNMSVNFSRVSSTRVHSEQQKTCFSSTSISPIRLFPANNSRSKPRRSLPGRRAPWTRWRLYK